MCHSGTVDSELPQCCAFVHLLSLPLSELSVHITARLEAFHQGERGEKKKLNIDHNLHFSISHTLGEQVRFPKSKLTSNICTYNIQCIYTNTSFVHHISLILLIDFIYNIDYFKVEDNGEI